VYLLSAVWVYLLSQCRCTYWQQYLGVPTGSSVGVPTGSSVVSTFSEVVLTYRHFLPLCHCITMSPCHCVVDILVLFFLLQVATDIGPVYFLPSTGARLWIPSGTPYCSPQPLHLMRMQYG